ncbi:MAG: phosphonate ABC transporter, permease protein PhnE, partial [Pseudomonadota bacterium]
MSMVALDTLKADADAMMSRKRLVAFSIPVAILAYLTYVFFAFGVPELIQKASAANARTLVADIYSHKVHVARDNRSGAVEVAIEGENKGTYPEGESPDWVALGETTVIDLGD